MYKILKSQTDTENGVEARLAKIPSGYTVGVWDLDAGEYYSLVIFPYSMGNALEKAEAAFAKIAE